MKVVLIDDQQHAIDVLEFHLTSMFQDIEITATFRHAMKALTFLQENTVDLIFTDIDMPGINGVEMTTLLSSKKIPIVYVTAHQSYALEAIKLNVFDYLLKPIDTEELERIYTKYKSQHKSTNKIEFKISNRHIITKADEIVYVSSEGNYSTVHFINRPKIILTKNMKKMIEAFFSADNFFRCHRSFLVNLDHILEFNHHEIILSGSVKVSLARNYIEALKQRISD